MKFRQHEGGLEESMATVVELKNRDELTGNILGVAISWPTVKTEAELISFELYEGNGDDRLPRGLHHDPGGKRGAGVYGRAGELRRALSTAVAPDFPVRRMPSKAGFVRVLSKTVTPDFPGRAVIFLTFLRFNADSCIIGALRRCQSGYDRIEWK
jgi:hypothetical protein